MQLGTFVGIFLLIMGMLIFIDYGNKQLIHPHASGSVALISVEPNEVISSPSLLGGLALVSGIMLISEMLKKVSCQCDKFEERKHGNIRHTRIRHRHYAHLLNADFPTGGQASLPVTTT